MAGLAFFLTRDVSGSRATLPISDSLNLEESTRLLHAIFPNYPALYPCRPIPPKDEWFTAATKPGRSKVHIRAESKLHFGNPAA